MVHALGNVKNESEESQSFYSNTLQNYGQYKQITHAHMYMIMILSNSHDLSP